MCGGKLSRYKVSYDCHTTTNKAKLAQIGVITADDRIEVHPQRFCYGCNNICKRTEKAIKEGRDYTPRLTKFKWEESGSEAVLSRVGQKPKKAPIGRPSHLIVELVAYMKEEAPQSVPLAFALRERLSRHPSMDGDLKCLVCHLMLDRPLQLTICKALICMLCCVRHTYRYTDLQCPCGGTHTIDRTSVVSAPTVVQRMLRDIAFPCERCQQAVPAGMCK